MTKHYPPIQVVNEDDQPIGGASLKEVYGQGLLHRVVLIVLKDGQGRILLQRRGPKVATNANRWDVSAAGHVDEGENYSEAASRELSEEVGVTSATLNEIVHYRTNFVLEGYRLNRFLKIYGAEISADTKFTINPEELSEVRWFETHTLETQMLRHPEEFNNDFKEIFHKIKTWL